MKKIIVYDKYLPEIIDFNDTHVVFTIFLFYNFRQNEVKRVENIILNKSELVDCEIKL